MKSTDNQEEMFVVVDKDDNVIGKATRRVCHNNNKIIHRGIYVFLINGNRILVEKRGREKDIEAGKLDIAIAEHTLSGESYEQTAIRGIKEELNIIVRNITKIKKIRRRSAVESEFVMIFVTKTKKETDKMRFDKREISGIKYYDIEKIKSMFKSEPKKFACWTPIAIEALNDYMEM